MIKHYLRFFLITISSTIMLAQTISDNPFFEEWNTPFQTPPFSKIKNEHFLPALKEGIRQSRADLEAIINNTEPPTFQNTIAAL